MSVSDTVTTLIIVLVLEDPVLNSAYGNLLLVVHISVCVFMYVCRRHCVMVEVQNVNVKDWSGESTVLVMRVLCQ